MPGFIWFSEFHSWERERNPYEFYSILGLQKPLIEIGFFSANIRVGRNALLEHPIQCTTGSRLTSLIIRFIFPIRWFNAAPKQKRAIAIVIVFQLKGKARGHVYAHRTLVYDFPTIKIGLQIAIIAWCISPKLWICLFRNYENHDTHIEISKCIIFQFDTRLR